MKRTKQTSRTYRSDPKGYKRFICCEEGCEEGVARNLDGTTEGNYRCDKHTFVYYAPVFARQHGFHSASGGGTRTRVQGDPDRGFWTERHGGI